MIKYNKNSSLALTIGGRTARVEDRAYATTGDVLKWRIFVLDRILTWVDFPVALDHGN